MRIDMDTSYGVVALNDTVESADQQARAEQIARGVNGVKSAIGNLAREICGECVPRTYVPQLKESMDQIQELAGKIA